MIEKDRLQETYNQLLPLMGENPESFEAILQVEAHRQFWRPKQPKVVLLAESHVYTSHHELNTMWGYQPEIAGIPKTYVRLVYCLGYGENNFVGWPVDGNRGTPQFWKIFYSCIQGPDIGFAPVLKSRTCFDQRISNKLELLRNLQDKGIWLLDASVIALYRPGAVKPDPETIIRATNLSWQHYVSHEYSAASPQYTICIGKGVERAIGQQLRDMIGERLTVLPQPQARLSSNDHHAVLKTYYEICQQYGASSAAE